MVKFTIKGVLSIFIIMLIGAEILPTAFNSWFNASNGTSAATWTVATRNLWILVPLLVVVVFIAKLASDASDAA